jgi:hypothetical protein
MRTPRVTPSLASIAITALALGAGSGGQARAGADAQRADAPRGHLRAALPAREGPHSPLWPLAYWGGFQTKTAVYEPLVRFGKGGVLEPALAASWEVADAGRTVRLRLREGVVCHDGTPLTAGDVPTLLRWQGPATGGSGHGPHDVGRGDRSAHAVRLSEPWCFLEECAIVNPSHVVPAGAYDHEGTFRKPVGTGPYAVSELGGTGEMVLTPHEGWWQGRPGIARIELTRLPAELRETSGIVDWVRGGGVDLVADGEGPIVPREPLAALAGDPRVRVHVGPGSGTALLLFDTRRGPFQDRELRRRVAAAIDRNAFVRRGELAMPSPTPSSGGFAGWPAKGPSRPRQRPRRRGSPRTWCSHRRVRAGAAQPPCSPHSSVRSGSTSRSTWPPMPPTFRARVAEGRADRSHPDHARHAVRPVREPPDALPGAGGRAHRQQLPALFEDDALVTAVKSALGATTVEARVAGFAAIQRRLDESSRALYIPHRVALTIGRGDGPRDRRERLRPRPGPGDLHLPRADRILERRARGLPAPRSGRGRRTCGRRPGGGPRARRARGGRGPEGRRGRRCRQSGWNASLVLDNRKDGVWAVQSYKVFDRLGCPEIVASTTEVVHRPHRTAVDGRPSNSPDGKWLGSTQMDLEGPELTSEAKGQPVRGGGASGGRPRQPPGGRHSRVRRSNILVAADVDASRPGAELVAFTWPDGLYVLGPSPGKRASTSPSRPDAGRCGTPWCFQGRRGRPRS